MNPTVISNDRLKDIPSLDWECQDSDTRYLTHNIHRYSGKFIPQIASQVISIVTKENDLILDPYCGSGTTLLECLLNQRRSIGLDLNPLAVLISKVKTTKVENKKLDQFLKTTKKELEPLSWVIQKDDLFGGQMNSITHAVQNDARWSDDWYKKWFNDTRKLELIAIDQYLSKIEDVKLRNIGLVALSDILRSSSNAHSSYPNVMYDSKKNVTMPSTPKFIKRLEEICTSINLLEKTAINFIPKVLMEDARNIPIEDNSINAVITHPPYIASIPYAEYGVLSLRWLGCDPKKIDAILTGGMRHKKDVVERFSKDFRKTIEECYRVLKSDGIFFMLLGNPTVDGCKIDLSQMAKEFSTSVGFKMASESYREGINRRANLMGKETLLFFIK